MDSNDFDELAELSHDDKRNNVLKELIFIITTRCNQNCIFCCEPAGQPDMDLKKVVLWLQDIYKVGISSVDFSGGEPLLHPDIIPILKYSNKLGLFNTLSTNGMLVSRYIELIYSYVDQWNLSIHGTEEVHDSIAQNQGSFQQIRQACSVIAKRGGTVHITYVVTESNIQSIHDVINDFIQLGVKKICFNYLFRRGKGKQILSNQTIEQKKVLNYVNDIIRLLPEADITIYHNLNLDGQCLLVRYDGEVWGVPMSNTNDYKVVFHMSDIRNKVDKYPYISNHLDFTFPRLGPVFNSKTTFIMNNKSECIVNEPN